MNTNTNTRILLLVGTGINSLVFTFLAIGNALRLVRFAHNELYDYESKFVMQNTAAIYGASAVGFILISFYLIISSALDRKN
jgi:hypothetical protein